MTEICSLYYGGLRGVSNISENIVCRLSNSYNMIKEALNLDPGPTYSLKISQNHREATSFGWPIHPSRCRCNTQPPQPHDLGVCFNPDRLLYLGPQMSGYLCLLQIGLVLVAIITLSIGIPLMVVSLNGGWCQNGLNCSQWFVVSFSIFNSWGSHDTTNLIFYLALPVSLLSCLLMLYARKRLSQLRKQYYNSHACFLKLPFYHLTEPYLISQIDSWWQNQLVSQQAELAQLCPELTDNNALETSSDDGPRLARASSYVPSKYVDKIVLSYNYTSFRQLQEQLRAFGLKMQGSRPDREQLNQLMELQKRKKRMSQDMSKNNYCVVIFKRSSYSSYFFHKNNPSIAQKICSCSQNFSIFQIQGKKVEVQRDLLPRELCWQNMHLSWSQRNKHWGILCLAVAVVVSAGLWAGLALLCKKLTQDGSSAVTYMPYIGSLIVYAWLWLFENINQWASNRECPITKTEKNNAFIIREVVFNVCSFLLFPFLMFSIIETSLIWSKSGLIETLFILLLVYNLTSLLSPYLGWKAIKSYYYLLALDETQHLNQQEANEKLSKPSMHLSRHIIQLVTNIYLGFFLTPVSGIFGFVSLAWIGLTLLLHRINICHVWRQQKCHGLASIQTVMSLVESSPLLAILSIFMSALLASFNTSYSFNAPAISLSLLSVLIVILFLLVPPWRQYETSSDQTYQTLHEKYMELYEQTNEPYEFMSNKSRVKDQEVRLKVEEQMNTMSKTLSLSLKEQLMGRQTTVLENIEQLQEVEEGNVDNIYFQYEQKVFMKPVQPKIAVPPLFKRSQEPAPKPEVANPMGLGSLFGSDEKDKLKHVKKMIRDQVKANEFEG